MAKFQLTIETEDGGELAALVAGMFGRHTGPAHVSQGHQAEILEYEGEETSDQGEAQAQAAAPKQTRQRRTKAQIEADNAAAAAGTPEPSSSTIPTETSPAPANGAAPATPSPSSNGPSTQTSTPESPSNTAGGEAPTLDELKIILTEKMKSVTTPVLLEVIKTASGGSTGLSAANPSTYAAIKAALLAVV